MCKEGRPTGVIEDPSWVGGVSGVRAYVCVYIVQFLGFSVSGRQRIDLLLRKYCSVGVYVRVVVMEIRSQRLISRVE